MYKREISLDYEFFDKVLTVSRNFTRVLESAVKDYPPQLPFSSARDRERKFLDSALHPKSYYNFTAFGVRICVHFLKGYSYQKKELKYGDYYFVACCGFIPDSREFTCYSRDIPLADKFEYYNPTEEFETAVVDFYHLVTCFLRSLGVKPVYRQQPLPF